VGEYGGRVRQYPSISTHSPEYAALQALFIVVLVVVVAGGAVALIVYLTRCYVRGGVGRSEEKAADDGVDTAATQPNSSIVLVLTASFKPRYWWYPTVILLRRLTLLLMLTFVQTGLYSWLTIANYLFLTLHLLLIPYARTADSALELLTNLALTTQCGVLSAYSTPQSRPGWASGLLWLLFALPLAVGVAAGLWLHCCRMEATGRCWRWLSRQPQSAASPGQTQQQPEDNGLVSCKAPPATAAV
jgi:hypothetical protein